MVVGARVDQDTKSSNIEKYRIPDVEKGHINVYFVNVTISLVA